MITHSPSFDGFRPQEPRADSDRRSPRLAFVEGWGRDEKPAIPMRRSRIGTWVAAIAGAALGIGAIALYSAGVIGGATLNETPMNASREPNTARNSEYERAALVQARAFAATPAPLGLGANESALPASMPPLPDSTPAAPAPGATSKELEDDPAIADETTLESEPPMDKDGELGTPSRERANDGSTTSSGPLPREAAPAPSTDNPY